MSDSSSSVGLLSYETLVHAVAGAMGSVTAMTVFFPLDTARIRLQVDENRKSQSTPVILAEIAKEEGILSLYRGWFPVISSLCCSNFVYFYTFNTLKRVMVSDRSKPSKDLLMGFISDAFSQIIANEGVGTLWNGTLPSLVLVFNPAVQFMFYEAMKRRAGRGGRKISSFEIFLIGAIAKAIATTATYPLQTVQAILRFGQYKSDGKGGLAGSLKNVVSLLMDRIKRHGPLGLYKGLEAKLLQTVLTAALMFVVYEKITAATFKLMGIQKKLKH
ncbi:peroxisomal membrane PMP34-like protein [Labeo rohita]|uniref:Peroxisomal membrane PMP34-like protein n=1 Tax=Labeo rohita TaxID=84645 RepID=A0A498LGR3_LABRO|nr:peroxisomal membrane PMP34-like protein [Labeo rohita]RXN29439.1 peroxisomal membrane PMP34-like protein [Labeo rohita]